MNEDERVIDNRAESRFELTVDGAVAELRYRRRADRLVLLHTEVPEAVRGHGIGGPLVKAAVERAAGGGPAGLAPSPFPPRRPPGPPPRGPEAQPALGAPPERQGSPPRPP